MTPKFEILGEDNRQAQDVVTLAAAWSRARSECIAEPIGSPGYREKLNRLSSAEDALHRAVRNVSFS